MAGTGDYRFGNFSNEDMASFMGLSIPQIQMLQEVLYPQYTGHAPGQDSIQYAMDLAGQQSGGGPGGGGANRLEDTIRAFEYLTQHPVGSKHHGFNPTDLIGNLATFGLYGAGKGLYNAAQGNVGSGLNEAINSPGIGGAIRSAGNQIEPGLGSSLAMKANLAGAGAGLGAMAFGGGQAAAGGTGGYVPPVEGMSATDSAAYFGFQDAPQAFGMNAGYQLGPDAALGAGIGAGAEAGNNFLGPAVGSLAANQLAGLFAPQGGGGGGALPAQQAMPAQQRGGAPSQAALGGDGGDVPGVGYIDPAYIKRQKGGKNSPGIANQQDLSNPQDQQMAALYGFTGGMS